MKEIHSQIIENLVDVVFSLSVEQDGTFRFISVNASFLSVTGLRRDQVVGKLVSEVIPEPSLSMVLNNYRKAITEKRPVHWNEVSEYPNGKKYGVVTVIPVFDDHGVCQSLIGTVHDLTPVKEAEGIFLKTMDRVSDGVVAFDNEMRFTFVNAMAAQFLKSTHSELIGKNCRDYFPEDEHKVFYEAYNRAVKLNQPEEVRNFNETWGVWFENRIYPSEDGVTVFFNDVTEHMKTKQAAEQAFVAKSQFLDIAAHELRNPVASLYLLIQLLEKQLDMKMEISEEKIRDLVNPAVRLKRLVADLLDMSRLEKNLVVLKKEKKDITVILPEWIQEMKRLHPNHKISFSSQIPSTFLQLDPVRIYQVFINILDNAIKYSAEGSSVGVMLFEKNNMICVSVKDQGEGMTEHMLSNIFNPFSRGGVDIRVRHTGLGIGLSICHHLVKLHDGNIKVESEFGKGSTVTFELPKGKA
jgi:PAS domain S-box-containing protein